VTQGRGSGLVLSDLFRMQSGADLFRAAKTFSVHARGLILLFAYSAGLIAQVNRVTTPVDNARRTALSGHRHPLARAEFDRGAVDSSLALASMTLTLKQSPSQQAELARLLAAQQDPSSPDYHHWLTPEEFADRFGASSDDIAKITNWLTAHGFKVTAVARGRNWISFSGTAGQATRAFGSEIHHYEVGGELHYASSTDPNIPAAFGTVVQNIRGLNDFRMKPMLKPHGAIPASTEQPLYTSPTSGNHYLAPDDFATIYDIKPLYNAGINGSGQKLVVAGQTQINISDIEQFRSRFNLPANDPQVMLVPNTQDPGVSQSDLAEADLDLELSGATAPNASILFLYSNDVMNAVQYAIDQNLAPVISISYGSCEPETPASDALTFQQWAQQGNAQGITWVAASGDSGGADCVSQDSNNDGEASVDVPASIPEVTGVGGTEFSEGTGQFWGSTNNTNSGSAFGYIPETVWNDSTPGNPGASGGGASVIFAKPSWQTGPGVPNNSARNVPDLSLTSSADHDGFLVITGGQLQVYGGTSVASPSFAGIVTLLNQYVVTKGIQSSPGLGNINLKLYPLAQSAAGAFHDTTVGNNIVTVTCGARARNCTPGSYGFNAGVGYDQATGLGSIDVSSFFTAWSGGSVSSPRATPSVMVTAAAASITTSGSTSVTATVASSNGGTPTGTVSFSYNGVGLGTAALSGSGGSATASVTVSGSQLAAGSDSITAQYSGDASYSPAGASITINVTAATGAPTIAGMTNGASFRQGFAPGGVLTIFGSSLAPAAASASMVPLPSQLGGVTVSINGVMAPLYYASSSQLNVQIPYETPANSTVSLQVMNNGQTVSSTFATKNAAPGIFTDANGALVPTKAASAGQIISLYLTGAGAVSPSIATGAAPPLGTAVANLPMPVQSLTVSVGGIVVQPQFVGIPPLLVGVVQVNFAVPSGLSGSQSVVVNIGGVSSPPATLTVQ
jgi:uncharacterized protein (TIGR03437 family)